MPCAILVKLWTALLKNQKGTYMLLTISDPFENFKIF